MSQSTVDEVSGVTKGLDFGGMDVKATCKSFVMGIF